MHRLKLVYCLTFLLIACRNQKENSENEKEKQYFDITAYLKSQYLYLDTIPFAFIKYVTKNGTTDSSFIKKDEIKNKIYDFITPETEPKDFPKKFSENIYEDANTNIITLAYEANNKNDDLQRIDVNINSVSQKISNLYMVKINIDNDTFVKKQFILVPFHNLKLITTKSVNSYNETSEEKIVWDE